MAPGRPLDPVEGFGPVAEFAHELRVQWVRAGSPKLTAIARAGRSTGSLSPAIKGRRLPTAETTKVFLMGCRITDEGELADWERRRQEAAAAATRFTCALSSCGSLSDLRARLLTLMVEQDLDVGTLHTRLRTVRDPTMSREEIIENLHGPLPLDPDALAALVIAVGGTPDDAQRWKTHREHIADDIVHRDSTEPRPRDDSTVSAPSLKPAPATATIVRPEHRLRGVRRYVVIAIATLALLSIGLITVHVRRGEGQLRAVTPKEEPAPSPQPESVATRTAAAAKLADLSRRVRQRSEQRFEGRYTYIHRKVWWPNATATKTDANEEVDDIRLWWASDDRSGRSVTTTTEAPGSSRSPAEQWYIPDELFVPMKEPSEDPRQLGLQFAAMQGPEVGAAGRLRAVATMNNFYDPTPAQRACVLQVLADTPGVTYRGQYLDRVDRAGLAFSADTSRGTSITRDTLVFDESTGVLLAHESATIPDNGSGPPSVASHIAYLERSRTSTTS